MASSDADGDEEAGAAGGAPSRAPEPSEASHAPDEGDPSGTDEPDRARFGRAGRVGVAAIVVAALAVVAVTTPAPRAAEPPAASPTGTVAGAIAAPGNSATPRPAPTKRPSVTEAPSRNGSPTPTPAETSEIAGALRGVYGSGMAADSKANLPVGPWGRVSHRFVASTTSPALGVRFSQRGGPDGYSGGSGGTIRVSLQEDAAGAPSGEALAELFLEPGNEDGDWTRFDRLDFPAPADLTEGTPYHVVYENVDPAPLQNFISVNDLFVYDAGMLSRPPGLDADFATLDEEDGEWDVQSRYTPVVDVIYADGTHDGQGYIEALVEEPAFMVGDLLARQWFVVSGGDRLVERVSVRVRRTYGEGPLTIRLETADGTELASVAIPAEQIRVGVPGDFGDEVSEVWVTAAFPQPQTLTSGLGYNLVLSTDAETEYSTIPLREGIVEGLESYRFVDGDAEQTYDGGTVWIEVFDRAPADLQFFFE